MEFWLVFLSACGLALIFTPAAIRLAPKIGAVDIPKDDRRMHTKAMPRFGGMAIFIGTISALAIFLSDEQQYLGIIIGGVLIYILGVVDDLKTLPAKVKLLGQMVCAAVVYCFGVRISFITAFLEEEGTMHFFPEILCFVLTVLWIVGITNAVNLIDGLDGLAAGVSAIAAFSVAYAAYIHGYYPATMAMLAIAGGALGFLPFNFHPAKIFMGDSGSLFLGFMLSTVSIVGTVKGSTLLSLILPILVLGLPIFDTAFAIGRRVVNHRPIMEPDKGHLHHRLMAAGLGQRRTVLSLYGISAILGTAAVVFSRNLYVETLGLLAIAAMYVYIYLTDAQHLGVHLKGVNTDHAERKEKKEKETK